MPQLRKKQKKFRKHLRRAYVDQFGRSYYKMHGKRYYVAKNQPRVVNIAKRNFLAKNLINARLPILEQQNMLYQEISNAILQKGQEVYDRRNARLDLVAKNLEARRNQSQDLEEKKRINEQIADIQNQMQKNRIKKELLKDRKGPIIKQDLDNITWFSKSKITKSKSSKSTLKKTSVLSDVDTDDYHDAQVQKATYESLKTAERLKKNFPIEMKEKDDFALPVTKIQLMKKYSETQQIKDETKEDDNSEKDIKGQHGVGMSIQTLKNVLKNIFYHFGYKIVVLDDSQDINNKVQQNKDTIVCFVRDNHLSVAIFHDNSCEYFEPQCVKKRQQQDIKILRQIALKNSPEHEIYFKHNTNQVQGKNEGNCGLYCMLFLFRRIIEQKTFQHASFFNKKYDEPAQFNFI